MVDHQLILILLNITFFIVLSIYDIKYHAVPKLITGMFIIYSILLSNSVNVLIALVLYIALLIISLN